MTGKPDSAAGKQRGAPFKRGQSGNPSGRPKGSRHKLTILAETLIEGDAEAVIRAVIAEAKKGDMAAAKLVIERILPPRKDRPISFKLPQISGPTDAPRAMAAIAAAVATSELTPAEGREIASIVEIYVRAVETAEVAQLAARLDDLEKETRR
jgi:hypothetical protein